MNAGSTLTLINGHPGGEVSVAERALQYGDGLFETIVCRDGRPCWLPRHLQRLQHGCERLRLPFRDYEPLRREIGTLAAAEAQCIVKAIISRGPALRRGYQPRGDESPTRIVSRHAWPDEGQPGAARVETSAVRLGINPLLAGLKHLNRLEQVLAQLARAPDIDEVLMLSSLQHVIGGSMSNVFLADDTGLVTPQLDECGVEGIMRGLVLAAARELPLTVRPVAPAELAGVHEVFLTNVRWGLRSVAVLDGRALPGDDYARRLHARIEQWMSAESE